MFASVSAARFLRALRNTRKNKWIRRAIAVLELLTVGCCVLVFFAASIVWVLPPKSRGDVEWTAISTFWIVLALGVYWATKPVLQLIGFMVRHPEHGADH